MTDQVDPTEAGTPVRGRRGWLLLSLLGVGAAVVAGAVSIPGDERPAAAMERAKDRLAAAETARVEATVEVSGPGSTTRVVMEGEVDFGSGAASFAFDHGGIGSFTMIETGNLLFVRGQDPGWVRIEVGGGLEPEQGFDAVGADPRDMLALLDGVIDVAEVGRTEIDGVEVTQFSGRARFIDILTKAGMPEAQIDDIQAEFEAKGVDPTLTLDAYVDDDGLVRRLVTEAHGGEQFTQTATIDLLDFGEPVDIEGPPEAEVVREETASTLLELQQVIVQVASG